MKKTCPKSEYLSISEGIYSLASGVLDSNDMENAERISESIAFSKTERREAIMELKKMIGVRPKRPLYYVTCHHLDDLPHWTRDTVRYMGDYVDQLVKYLSSEKLKNPKNLYKSLGPNLMLLSGKIEQSLYKNLVRYNNLIYVPAKHDFSVKYRKHLFTAKEVVFICFISLRLKDQIISISEDAKGYLEERLNYISEGAIVLD